MGVEPTSPGWKPGTFAARPRARVHQGCGDRNRTCVVTLNRRPPVPSRAPPQQVVSPIQARRIVRQRQGEDPGCTFTRRTVRVSRHCLHRAEAGAGSRVQSAGLTSQGRQVGRTAYPTSLHFSAARSGGLDLNQRSPAPNARAGSGLSHVLSRESAQRELNPHIRHGKATGCRYIMGAYGWKPNCQRSPEHRTNASGWCPDSNPRRRTTTLRAVPGAESSPLDDQCL